MPRPELKEFLTDPKHQTERDFLYGVFDDYMMQKKKKADEERAKNPQKSQNLFDALFGSESDE